jgi:hypothetical protein
MSSVWMYIYCIPSITISSEFCMNMYIHTELITYCYRRYTIDVHSYSFDNHHCANWHIRNNKYHGQYFYYYTTKFLMQLCHWSVFKDLRIISLWYYARLYNSQNALVSGMKQTYIMKLEADAIGNAVCIKINYLFCTN